MGGVQRSIQKIGFFVTAADNMWQRKATQHKDVLTSGTFLEDLEGDDEAEELVVAVYAINSSVSHNPSGFFS